MKKVLLLALLLLPAFGFAQGKKDKHHEHRAAHRSEETRFPNAAAHSDEDDHEGRWIIGGSLGFWQQKEDNKKLTSFEFNPEVGYLFNERWGLGVVAGLKYANLTSQGIDLETASTWSLRPFARYYYLHRGPFNLFLDGGFGVSKVKGVSDLGFEVGLRPGACIDLTKGLCLCLRLGFLGYRDRWAGEAEDVPATGFGLRFAPEELRIGLELEL